MFPPPSGHYLEFACLQLLLRVSQFQQQNKTSFQEERQQNPPISQPPPPPPRISSFQHPQIAKPFTAPSLEERRCRAVPTRPTIGTENFSPFPPSNLSLFCLIWKEIEWEDRSDPAGASLKMELEVAGWCVNLEELWVGLPLPPILERPHSTSSPHAHPITMASPLNPRSLLPPFCSLAEKFKAKQRGGGGGGDQSCFFWLFFCCPL